MDEFIDSLRNKQIHIVGASGAEGSNILKWLVKNHLPNITCHDFADQKYLQKNYNLWHKNLMLSQKQQAYVGFLADLKKTKFYSGNLYLHDIETADIVFVPQSWRLYPAQNKKVWDAKKKGIPFFSLTRIYLDLSIAKIIAVTGTVGKGSTANLIANLFQKAGKKVYFAGNETWKEQVADKLAQMSKDDYLVLEISHRQLQDGFTRTPDYVVMTNIYPNHLDEVTWEEYKNLKYSLVRNQTSGQLAVINYDNKELQEFSSILKSQILFYSQKNLNKNTINIQKNYQEILNNSGDQYLTNILAALTLIDGLGIDIADIIKEIPNIKKLTSRFEKAGRVNNISIFNDIKSTTPWATLAALDKLPGNTILVSGGNTKQIDYADFFKQVKDRVKFIVFMNSQLSKAGERVLPKNIYEVQSDFRAAMLKALGQASYGDNILISPGAANFHSLFLHGKYQLKNLITSLLLKERGLAGQLK